MRMRNARPGWCRSGRECVDGSGSDRLDLEHLGDGGADAALDPLLDRQGADRAGAARPHQPELEDPFLEADELHVAAVLAERGADHVERVLDLLEKTDHSRLAVWKLLCGRNLALQPRRVKRSSGGRGEWNSRQRLP